MTATVVGVFIHPKACPVCTDGQVQLCRPGTELGRIIPCPQCQDGLRLRELVSGWMPAPQPSGGAA